MKIPVDIRVDTETTLTPPTNGPLRVWDNYSYSYDPFYIVLTHFQGVTVKRGDVVLDLTKPVTLAPGFPLTITPAVAGTPGWVRGYYQITHHISAGDVGPKPGQLYLGARATDADGATGIFTTSSVREYRTRFKSGPLQPRGKELILYHFGTLKSVLIEMWVYNPNNTTWAKVTDMRLAAEFESFGPDGPIKKTIFTAATPTSFFQDSIYEIRVSGISSACKLMLCDPAAPPPNGQLGVDFMGPAVVYNLSELSSEVSTTTVPALTVTPRHLSFEMGDVGIPVAYASGATTTRPDAWPPGAPYFDTTLGKPIWKRLADGVWVDATGTAV